MSRVVGTRAVRAERRLVRDLFVILLQHHATQARNAKREHNSSAFSAFVSSARVTARSLAALRKLGAAR